MDIQSGIKLNWQHQRLKKCISNSTTPVCIYSLLFLWSQTEITDNCKNIIHHMINSANRYEYSEHGVTLESAVISS